MRRLYVITRRDLKPAYAGVQSGHAVAQYLIEYGSKNWKNEYLIYLTVADENELKQLLQRLQTMMAGITVFREPDLENEITAIACVPDKYKMFSKLPLLR